jgi:hypothetical protein
MERNHVWTVIHHMDPMQNKVGLRGPKVPQYLTSAYVNHLGCPNSVQLITPQRKVLFFPLIQQRGIKTPQ